MEFEKTEIRVSHIGWSDRVGQSFDSAVSTYVNKFNTLEDDMQRMRNMVREHVDDLREIAGAYRQAEELNESEAQSLPSDVIG